MKWLGFRSSVNPSLSRLFPICFNGLLWLLLCGLLLCEPAVAATPDLGSQELLRQQEREQYLRNEQEQAGAAAEQQANWLAYGNIEGIKGAAGLSYNNHPNDPVPTVFGGNLGQTNLYNDPNSPTHLQGVKVGNILRSILELKALFTTSDSAHSTYRWNDPSTWPTTMVEPVTNN